MQDKLKPTRISEKLDDQEEKQGSDESKQEGTIILGLL